MTKLPHECDEKCVCPVHDTALIYAPSVDKHACQDSSCIYAHGYEDRVFADFLLIRYGTS